MQEVLCDCKQWVLQRPLAKKTLAELKKTYEANAVPIDLGEDGFVVTRKIQPLLLIDEQNKKFCISGNPTVSKEYSQTGNLSL